MIFIDTNESPPVYRCGKNLIRQVGVHRRHFLCLCAFAIAVCKSGGRKAPKETILRVFRGLTGDYEIDRGRLAVELSRARTLVGDTNGPPFQVIRDAGDGCEIPKDARVCFVVGRGEIGDEHFSRFFRFAK